MITPRYCTWGVSASGLIVSLTGNQQGQNLHKYCGWASNYRELLAPTKTKVLSGCVSINTTNQIIILQFTKPQLLTVRYIVMLLLRAYKEYRPKDSFGAGHEGIQGE
jgi:hypothetical protein